MEKVQQAYQIFEQCQKTSHPHFAVVLDCLGLCYYDNELYSEAKSFLEKSKKMRENLYGNQHFYIAKTLSYLAKTYLSLGAPDLAVIAIEEKQKILTNNLLRDHFLYKEAEKLLEQCQSISLQSTHSYRI